MQEFIILSGLPGSGKSSLARKLKLERGFFIVSSDMVRLALNAGIYPRDDQDEYAALEPVVWLLVEQGVSQLLRAGNNVAIDATNLTEKRRCFWQNLARFAAPDVHISIIWCVGNWDSPERWANERGHTLAEYLVIRQKLEAMSETPSVEEGCEVFFYPGMGPPEARME